MKRLFSFAIALFLLIMSACVGMSAARSELEEHRNLWESHRIEDYDFTLHVMCFYCGPYGVADVQVRDNVTVSIVDRTTSPTMGSLIGQNERFADVDTIDELFDIVANALSEDTDWDIVEVEYNAEYGYPSSVFLNVEGWLDRDFRVTITDFEVGE
jgi:hypothetical protein